MRFFYLLLVVFLLNSCHVGRYFIYNFANINDYKKFPSRELKASSVPFHFTSYDDTTRIKTAVEKLYLPSVKSFEEQLDKSNTVALVVIKNDSILYQWFDNKYNDQSIYTSFSMAKSYVSTLIGIALEEGKIKSLDEPITNYIHSFKNSGFDKITIQNVLNMRTGIDYVENYYNPFGNVPIAYYGRNLDRHLSKIKVKGKPDQKFEYISIATQILGVILEEAVDTTLTAYCQEKLWSKIGTEYDATWSLDKKNGQEKAFCCLNARVYDYAKIGKLYLQNGKWNNEQIVPESWVKECTTLTPHTKDGFYANQWWRDTDTYDPKTNLMNYIAVGHLGQYVYVNPSNNTIVVRLGKNKGGVSWRDFLRSLSEV